VSVSLMDSFGTNTSVTQFAGIVLGRGSEIDLVSPSTLQSPSGSVRSTSTGSGLAIKWSAYYTRTDAPIRISAGGTRLS
jgi:hypothetical protein